MYTLLYGVIMIRSQIYLTQHERKFLSLFSMETGRSQSELIREALDQFIENCMARKKNAQAMLSASKGLWKDRDDLPDISKLRKEFDRDL